MAYTASWRSPSNIALIKYWGKYGLQLPRNPSLSFTLTSCHTDMHVLVIPESPTPGLVVLYDGIVKPAFEPKIKSFFALVSDQLPWLVNAFITIDSVNTFPHGAGIASSASSMSALSLCLADIDDQIHLRTVTKDDSWWKRVSTFARLGSGSACRSVFPVAGLWGEMPDIPESSNLNAIPWSDQISPYYHNYKDTILVVSSGEKKVSSTIGHGLMSGHPFETSRYQQAKLNLSRLIHVMQNENELDSFISICESEALQLHALMMSGQNPFILMEPGTISIIKEVWRFRKENAIPVCFTLDAGPNVHLLYPSSFQEPILDWIKTTLVPFCADGHYIRDEVGHGPEKI